VSAFKNLQPQPRNHYWEVWYERHGFTVTSHCKQKFYSRDAAYDAAAALNEALEPTDATTLERYFVREVQL
jgi:hypothetical protein